MNGLDLMKKNGYFWQWNGDINGPHALLTSGNHSGLFINATAACCDPVIISKIMDDNLDKSLLDISPNIQPDIIICPGYGAVGFASMLSFIFRIPWGFTDKHNGIHVLKRFNVRNKRALVVEDVTTTLSSISDVVTTIEKAGGEIFGDIITVFNRSGRIDARIGESNSKVVGIYNVPPDMYKPDECPYCYLKSEAMKPKENWKLFMEYNNY